MDNETMFLRKMTPEEKTRVEEMSSGSHEQIDALTEVIDAYLRWKGIVFSEVEPIKFLVNNVSRMDRWMSNGVREYKSTVVLIHLETHLDQKIDNMVKGLNQKFYNDKMNKTHIFDPEKIRREIRNSLESGATFKQINNNYIRRMIGIKKGDEDPVYGHRVDGDYRQTLTGETAPTPGKILF